MGEIAVHGLDGCSGDEIQLKGHNNGKGPYKAGAPGFYLFHEEHRWVNVDFAILILMDGSVTFAG